jgi:predicted RNA binding protein YcfA (HicA-like mRNA interferase family)
MPPIMKPEQVIKVLERNGFRFVKQKGSHRKYKKNEKTVIEKL